MGAPVPAAELATSDLARAGFGDTSRAARFLGDAALTGLDAAGVRRLGSAADADLALISLLRLAESIDDERERKALLGSIGDEDGTGGRLAVVLGASAALGDHLARHPDHIEALAPAPSGRPQRTDRTELRADLLRAVGADPNADVPVTSLEPREARDALRVRYRWHLLRIAGEDLTAADPYEHQPAASAALSDLADASLDAALACARAVIDGHEKVRLAIIAMGKTGARELNYISDVDVIPIVAPVDSADGGAPEEDDLIGIGSALAREVARVCDDRTAEGSLWQVDANLRPEGKDGPLVRTVESCRTYYESWADSWEFQALLKARAAAGDIALGDEFVSMVQPMVWQASTRDSYVEDSRAMRRRVMDHIPRGEVERNLKLGPGGLRDVEFTVQLVQMVHGRTDDSLQVRGTLEALERLRDGGYIGRENAAELDAAYRFLRAVEHRIQLYRLRRTHILPNAPADVRRLARTLRTSEELFTQAYERTRRRVRRLHEEIFYRPLLETSSRLSDGQVALSPEAAEGRLAAIGYRDPARALQHIEALTDGISRRAAIQRQLLPGLLEWFADGDDPDMGLLAFRRLSDEIGSAHWYMALLRDSGVAARRLTRLLSSSRYIGEELERFPGAVRWLARDSELRATDPEALADELRTMLPRVTTQDEATDALLRTRRRELLRIAMAHSLRLISPTEAAAALTSIAEVTLRAGIAMAERITARDLAGEESEPAELGIAVIAIAMGSFGAREMGYASDADVQFLVRDAGAGERTGELAVRVCSLLQKILNAPSSGADMKVSADLRPEGRNGVLARTVESWDEHYRTSADTWEKQALVRARVVVGTDEDRERVTALLDEHRYPASGVDRRMARDIAAMKARMEAERLPRGADSSRHLKLGRGAMTDVEWVGQRLIMDAAHDHAELRGITTTLPMLDALADAEVLSRKSAESLSEAWQLAWSLRAAMFLWRGRDSAVLPSDRADLLAAGRAIIGEGATAIGVEDSYLRATRHARAIAEEIIFGGSPA